MSQPAGTAHLLRGWATIASQPERAGAIYFDRLVRLNPELGQLAREHGGHHTELVQQGFALLASGMTRLQDFEPAIAQIRARLDHFGLHRGETRDLGQALVHTLSVLLGPLFTVDAEQAWRSALDDLVRAVLPRPTGRILIVDDDPVMRLNLTDLLAGEFDVATEENGASGLASMATQPADLMILDLHMPGMNGYEVCRRMKSHRDHRFVPVLVLTSETEPRALEQAYEAGADDFIAKPVSGIALLARVRSLMRIRRQYKELKHLMDLREDMIHLLVHDMRAPLQVIEGLSEMVLTEGEPAGQPVRDITEILTQARRLRNFLDEILTVAKMENNKLTLNCQPVEIQPLLERALASWQSITQPRRVTISPSCPDNLVRWVDPDLFVRVLDNLVGNAVKFSPRGKTVRVRVEGDNTTHDGAWRIHVEDEGSGIPATAIPTLFAKFAAVELHQKGIRQIGLGLTFCKLAIEAHGGTIRYLPGASGAHFRIDLPR
jgi:two-component system sensor histidine kinase/response regulator